MSKTRPTPKELADAIARAENAEAGSKRLLEDVGRHAGRITELVKQLDEAKGKITEREKDLLGDLASKDRAISRLKRQLFATLQELWATKGYLARVAEDDAIKELGPSFDTPGIPAAATPPMKSSRRSGPGILLEVEPETGGRDNFGRDKPPPPTPWFNL